MTKVIYCNLSGLTALRLKATDWFTAAQLLLFHLFFNEMLEKSEYFPIPESGCVTMVKAVFHWKQETSLIDFNGPLHDDEPVMTQREIWKIIIITIIVITPHFARETGRKDIVAPKPSK